MTATVMEFPSKYAESAEPIPLAGFSGIWLRFHLLAITPLQLSAYKGSTFHGAFGWALRRLYRPLYDQLYAPQRKAWYAARWGIEVYHRTLKSGCQIETRQLGSADRIEACLAIDMVVAWRILHLTKLGRDHPDVPCTLYFAEPEWKALLVYINRSPVVPATPPSLREATRMLASLGGFLGRKSDGEPGTQTLWLGLQRLDDLTAMYQIVTQTLARPPPTVSSSHTYG